MDDDIRNQLVEKIAAKINDEKIPLKNTPQDAIEYLQKFAITLGVDILKNWYKSRFCISR